MKEKNQEKLVGREKQPVVIALPHRCHCETPCPVCHCQHVKRIRRGIASPPDPVTISR